MGQQHASEVEHQPGRPIGAAQRAQIRHLFHTAFCILRRFRKALDEQHIRQVPAEVAHGQPVPARQMHHVAPQVGAENHKAQVHTKSRNQHHPHRRAAQQRRNRGQLCAAGKHHQRHHQGRGHAQAQFDHGHTGHQAPGSNTRRDSKLRDHALTETGMPVVRRMPKHGRA